MSLTRISVDKVSSAAKYSSSNGTDCGVMISFTIGLRVQEFYILFGHKATTIGRETILHSGSTGKFRMDRVFRMDGNFVLSILPILSILLGPCR